MDPVRAQSPALSGPSAQAASRGEPLPTTGNIPLIDALPRRESAAEPPGATAAHLVREGRAAQFRHLNPRAGCVLVVGVGLGVGGLAAGAASMGLALGGMLHAGPMAAWSLASHIGYCIGGASSACVGMGLVVLGAPDRSITRPATPANETVLAPPPQQMMRSRPRDIALVIQPNGAISVALGAARPEGVPNFV